MLENSKAMLRRTPRNFITRLLNRLILPLRVQSAAYAKRLIVRHAAKSVSGRGIISRTGAFEGRCSGGSFITRLQTGDDILKQRN
jgi:hypothetical protein